MNIFGLEIGRRQERRAADTSYVPVSDREGMLALFGIDSANVPHVTIDNALTVPAVAAAVTFLSRTMATLPLHAYRRSKSGPEKLGGQIQTVVHDAPNDQQDRFKFWQYFWQQVFTGGRGLAWIDRTPGGVDALWTMDPTETSIKRVGGEIWYHFDSKQYPSRDVIDVPFMLKADGLGHYGPIKLAAKAIQLSLAMNDYASGFFAGGAVPPLALTGPLPVGNEAMQRAMKDIRRSIEAARKGGESMFAIPPGYNLAPVGIDPDKSQMTDARRFQIEEIARSYQLPPVFLQDLSRATFNNAEQQDLHLVKHLIGQWCEALEGELNLKLFGRKNSTRYVEHNLDGLMRGDFKSRIEGLAKGVQNALLTPNEGRALENRPAHDNGDDLMIQGATVPLGSQPTLFSEPANDNDDDSGADAA